MSHVLPFDESELVRFADGAGVRALALTGSFARRDAGPHSDVDIIRLIDDPAERPVPWSGSHLIQGRLLVISDATPAAVKEWFDLPDRATEVVAALRVAITLLDRDGTFAAVQARAKAFVWDDAMQRKANAWASRDMVGWVEEVHKGLEGLQRNDVGRLLNARHGMTWGLTRVMQVQRGVLLSGDNGFYDELDQVIGRDSEWARLRTIAFAAAMERERAPTLREQVIAGLQLYALTARMIWDALSPVDLPLIRHTVDLIERN